jgi:hypothetical protein
VPAGLVVAAPPVAAIQTYGGIALFRAFLFALPWLAFFGAAALQKGSAPVRFVRARFLLQGAVMVALAASLLIAVFGQDLGHRVTADEVRAEAWVEQHAPRLSSIVHGDEGPIFLTRRYPEIGLEESLLGHEEFRGHLLGTGDVGPLESLFKGLRPSFDLFLVLSRRQDDYARLNGIVPAGSMIRLAHALEGTAAFRLVYRLRSAWVFEYVRHPEAHPAGGVRGVAVTPLPSQL